MQTLLTILNSTKATDIPNIVKSLPPESQDVLMKYLYKGMAISGGSDVNFSVLLSWLEKVSCTSHILGRFSDTLDLAVDRGCGIRMYCPCDDGPEVGLIIWHQCPVC